MWLCRLVGAIRESPFLRRQGALGKARIPGEGDASIAPTQVSRHRYRERRSKCKRWKFTLECLLRYKSSFHPRFIIETPSKYYLWALIRLDVYIRVKVDQSAWRFFRALVQNDLSGFGQSIAKEASHEVDRLALGLARTRKNVPLDGFTIEWLFFCVLK